MSDSTTCAFRRSRSQETSANVVCRMRQLSPIRVRRMEASEWARPITSRDVCDTMAAQPAEAQRWLDTAGVRRLGGVLFAPLDR
jgi:hypothetical protein